MRSKYILPKYQETKVTVVTAVQHTLYHLISTSNNAIMQLRYYLKSILNSLVHQYSNISLLLS